MTVKVEELVFVKALPLWKRVLFLPFFSLWVSLYFLFGVKVTITLS